jgi:hypothetical protein
MPCAAQAISVCMSLWLLAHGYTPYQRDAMLRQAWTESRYQVCVVNHRSGSLGLFQYNGIRRRKLLAMNHGLCPTWDVQLAFADAELRGQLCYKGFWKARPEEVFAVLRNSFGRGRCT